MHISQVNPKNERIGVMEQPKFSITVNEQDNNKKIIHVVGNLDAFTTCELEKVVNSLITKGYRRIVLDCEKISYISSTGLGCLMQLFNSPQEVDECILLNPNEKIMKILVLMFSDYDVEYTKKIFNVKYDDNHAPMTQGEIRNWLLAKEKTNCANNSRLEYTPPAQKLARVLAPFRRTAWIPQTIPDNGELYDSKFAGIACLRKNEEWPGCGICGQPMLLVVQLNLSKIPIAMQVNLDKQGYFQFFYCTKHDCEEKTNFSAFGKNKLIRIIGTDNLHDKVKEPDRPLRDIEYASRLITGWQERVDYPDREECESILGCRLEDDFTDEDTCIPNDKFGGWPYWTQGVRYPKCPKSREKMEYVFQINAEDVNLPGLFASDGTGHITRSKKFSDIMAFSWACG